MENLKPCFIAGAVLVILFSWENVPAFHKGVYQPRVPLKQLEAIQEIESPFPFTRERIEAGKKIFFGKGLCVTCHGKDGKGVKVPGHSPRNFTDPKWQEVRTDGELMWVLKNGSPGTGMPVRVGKAISEEEAWNVIQYVRSLGGALEIEP